MRLFHRGFFYALLIALSGTSVSAQPQLDQVSVPQLLKNLESDNVRIASSAARSLGVIFAPGGRETDEKTPAIEQLIKHLPSSKGADIRRECATALGRIQAKTAVEPLKKTMLDKDVEVAMAAGESVGKILPVDEARTFLKEVGVGDNEQIIVAAFHGLAPICKSEDAEFLLTGLSATNWRTQMNAVKGLERAVSAGANLTEENYDAVAVVFGNEITNAANATVHFFTHIRNEASFKAVLKAADTFGDGTKADTSWRARTYALRTLYHLGYPTNQPALPVVIRNLGDRTTNVTNEAKRILYSLLREKQLTHQDLFPLLLTELEKAESLPLRAGIMKEMGKNVERQFASRVAKVAADTLEKSLDEKVDPTKSNWPARAYSLTLLGASGYTDPIEQITTCVGDNVANVRNAAGKTLEQLHTLCTAEQKAKVAPLLQSHLTNPVDWRKTSVAAGAVGHYANSDSIKPLVALLGHSVLNVRQAASSSLVVVANSDQEELKTLTDTALHEELKNNPRSWEFGAKVLGALKDPKAVPMLTTMLTKGDWRTQASAAEAVVKISADHKVNDKALSDALINASQSEVLQVQDAANKALRELTRDS